MWHKPCRTFNPWCLCIKTRCLFQSIYQMFHHFHHFYLGIVHACSNVMGFFLRWQNMAFIFKVQTWNFVCGIRRSFAYTMENILSVWYTATPGWTSKFGKVWKTRCQNAATRANIWRCFLVSWDDKYLWVMVSNKRHELYLCSKLLCFSSIHCFFWPNTVSKYQTWTNSYLIPSNA